MRLIFLAVLLSALTIPAHAQLLEQTTVKNVSATEFRKIIETGKGKLVDIRTPKEFDMGHINGAVMIDYYAPDFKTGLNKLDKKTPIYIYCRSGNRSSQSIAILEQLGFKEIVNLQRGIIDWQNKGYPLVQ